MDTETEPQFVQAAPEVIQKGGAAGSEEEKVVETPHKKAGVIPGWGRQLREDELDEDADGLLCWLARYPVERNHPRPTTGAIAVTKSGDAVVCTSTDKIVDVLQKLVVEGFLAMPVISAATQKLIGFVDLLDIVWFTLWSFGVWRSGQSSATLAESKEYFGSFLALEKFRTATVMDVLSQPDAQASLEPPHHVHPGFSLMHVVETMARLSSHRVAICSSDLKVTGIITQSMVISLIDQHLDRLGTIATGHTVAEMLPGLVAELKLCQDSEMALSAFKMLVQQKVNGVAVVNASGELIDTISVRDLRGLGIAANDWQALWMNVAEFKAHCRAKYPQQTPQTPIYVKKSDTIETIIRKMDDGNIHRVFVCDENAAGKPVPTHCISQRDVLRWLLHLTGLKSTAYDTAEASVI